MDKLEKELKELEKARKSRKEEVSNVINMYFRGVALPTLLIANIAGQALVENGDISPLGALKAIAFTIVTYGIIGGLVKARIEKLVNLI